jgi:drug/metabolite transporter (DMT)-like permease
MTSRQWGWVLLTGVILAGYVGTWFAALSRAPAVDVTAVLVVAAVITTVLQAMVNDTPLVPDLKWLGLLVLGGALVLLPPPRRAAFARSA